MAHWEESKQNVWRKIFSTQHRGRKADAAAAAATAKHPPTSLHAFEYTYSFQAPLKVALFRHTACVSASLVSCRQVFSFVEDKVCLDPFGYQLRKRCWGRVALAKTPKEKEDREGGRRVFSHTTFLLCPKRLWPMVNLSYKLGRNSDCSLYIYEKRSDAHKQTPKNTTDLWTGKGWRKKRQEYAWAHPYGQLLLQQNGITNTNKS